MRDLIELIKEYPEDFIEGIIGWSMIFALGFMMFVVMG